MLPCWVLALPCSASSAVEPDAQGGGFSAALSFFLGVLSMASVAISAIFDLLDAFLSDPLGLLFAGVIMLGVIVALFRFFEFAAGGRPL